MKSESWSQGCRSWRPTALASLLACWLFCATGSVLHGQHFWHGCPTPHIRSCHVSSHRVFSGRPCCASEVEGANWTLSFNGPMSRQNKKFLRTEEAPAAQAGLMPQDRRRCHDDGLPSTRSEPQILENIYQSIKYVRHDITHKKEVRIRKGSRSIRINSQKGIGNKEHSFRGMLYVFWCETNPRVVRTLVVFQDRPMFSHMTGKPLPRLFQWWLNTWLSKKVQNTCYPLLYSLKWAFYST